MKLELNEDENQETYRLLTNDSMKINTYRTVLNLKKKKNKCDGKSFAFFFIGSITFLYCIGELG